MKHFVLTLFLLFSSQLFAQKIAITIDDLPFSYSRGLSEKGKIEAFDKILQALEKHQVKATMFVTSGNISDSTKVILDKALRAGHQLGNHTHKHLDLNKVSAKIYINDVDSCSMLANDWIDSRYFRYSMLHRGNTQEKKDSVYNFLEKNNFIIAPVTIDNDDWMYNRGYSLAMQIGDGKNMDRISKDYLNHMQEATSRYEKMSSQLIGRQIPHILLLHSNAINADYLDKLLSWYSKKGWEFISLDEALKDDFYSIKEDYIGPYGFSQLDRIKESRGE